MKKTTATATTAPAIERIRAIGEDLKRRYRNREEVIDCMIASMISGELLLLLGLRGEAKTALVEALAGYVSDGRHFSVGLAKSSSPDEILGGPDLVALQSGTYRRATAGFLPEAHTFLLDEGFKSNNPTLQSLLRVLSEREFQGVPVPTIFGAIASNELPAELRGQKAGKAADLGPFEDSLLAFFDRFFYKLEVAPLTPGTVDWGDVVFGGVADLPAAVSVTVDEIRAEQAAARAVTIPQPTRALLTQLAEILANGEAGGVVHVSTRTWRKAVGVLKAHAHLAGRAEVTRDDMLHLVHALWTTPDQKAILQEAILQTSTPEMAEALAIETKVAQLDSAAKGRRLHVDDGGSLAVSDKPLSALAAAGASKVYLDELRSNSNALRQILISDGLGESDKGQIEKIKAYVDGVHAAALEEALNALKGV